MRIGVMSDSHDHVPNVERAVDIFNQRGVERVFHGGDFVAPFAVRPFKRLGCQVMAVFGNNDGERVGLWRAFEDIGEVHPNLAELTLGERRIAMTHYPELAGPIAESGLYDLVIYGHTHEVDVRRGRALTLNPGETGGWLTGKATIAIVDLGAMEVEIVEL